MGSSVVVVVELVVVVVVVVSVVVVVVVGTQHAVPQSPTPDGQQSPNKLLDFLTMAFAQFRLQQLMCVEQTVPSDLQPPARACVLTRSAVLATSAKKSSAAERACVRHGRQYLLGRTPPFGSAPSARFTRGARGHGRPEVFNLSSIFVPGYKRRHDEVRNIFPRRRHGAAVAREYRATPSGKVV